MASCMASIALAILNILKNAKRKTTEATLWEIKYFKVTFAEVIFCTDTKIGIIASIFTSSLSQ
jgi:hypothetical protein